MTELISSEPSTAGAFNSQKEQWAIDELTSLARSRRTAHDEANLFRDYHVLPEHSPTHPARDELTLATTALARWLVLGRYDAIKTVDLAYVENNGSWSATDAVEAEVAELGAHLRREQALEAVIPRDGPEARRRIIVEPALLSMQGLVSIRRKRRVLQTTSTPHRFYDLRPLGAQADPVLGNALSLPYLEADVHTEVDKVSDFVVDIRALGAEEVRRIIASHASREATHPATVTAIEAAIRSRSAALIPAVTTYYADRKYSNVRPALAA